MSPIKSLRVKAIIWTLTPTLLVLSVIAVTSIYVYEQVARNVVQQRDSDIAELSAAQLADQLGHLVEPVQAIADTDGIRSLEPPRIQAELSTAKQRSSILNSGTTVYDSQANPLYSDQIDIISIEPALFNRTRDSITPGFSNVMQQAVSGNEVVILAAPITSSEGQFQGVLAVNYSLKDSGLAQSLGQLLSLHALEATTNYLIDNNGRVVYHADPGKLGLDLSEQLPLTRMLDGETGSVLTGGSKGEKVIASYAPVPGTQWHLVTEESWSQVISPIREWGMVLVGLLMVGGVTAAGLIFWATGQVLSPIRQLTEGVKRVAGGDFDHAVEGGGGEIQELAAQFNSMAVSLRDSRALLEDRVTSRTEELRQSQEAERKLAEENALLGRIGQIMSSTLDIGDVYEQFSQEVKKLADFDRMAINVIDHQTGTFVFKYASGLLQPDRNPRDVIPLAGTRTEAVMKSGKPLLEADISQSAAFPASQPALSTGIRSVIMLPLTSKGQVIGTLSLRSRQVGAYGPAQLAILERLANQIAPAVENAELYAHARQAEQALRESEQRYRELVDRARDVIYTVAPDTTLLSLNPAFETITGWSRQEWIGKSFTGMLHPDDLPLVADLFQRSLQGEQLPIFEHRVLAKTGEYLTGEFLAAPQIKDGEVVAVLGIARDVTGRKRAEEALRESEERYRSLFEQSRDAIFITRDGTVVDTNQAALDLFGYTREEAIGLEVGQVYANPEDRGRFRDELLRSGSVKDFPLHLVRKDGTHIDCMLTAADRLDADGNVFETQGIIRDVTAHNRAEEALRQSEDRLRRAQQAGRLGTWDWHVDRQELIWDGVEPIHGLEPGTFDGNFSTYLKDVHPDDRAYVMETITAATESGSDINMEYRIIWPDGSLHWVLGTGRPFKDETGRTIQLTGTCQEITQRKEAEEAQIQQASELAVLGERNRMAREIHDTLAQGFTGIILQLEAAEQAQDDDPSEALGHIVRAKYLARDSLQEARRTVWGLLPQTLEQLPFEDALREAVGNFQAETQVEASFELQGSRKELSANAKTALLRICQESLNNAKRHARASNVKVNLRYKGKEVVLDISDNGGGFDPEKLTATAENGGFGLKGMEQRAKLLGGTLKIKSGYGKGTLVEARIPTA